MPLIPFSTGDYKLTTFLPDTDGSPIEFTGQALRDLETDYYIPTPTTLDLICPETGAHTVTSEHARLEFRNLVEFSATDAIAFATPWITVKQLSLGGKFFCHQFHDDLEQWYSAVATCEKAGAIRWYVNYRLLNGGASKSVTLFDNLPMTTPVRFIAYNNGMTGCLRVDAQVKDQPKLNNYKVITGFARDDRNGDTYEKLGVYNVGDLGVSAISYSV